ncbi:MucR family transcriptional regulator [Sphingomonas colocasiae]|uniref:MucR family transcriptional regulator n=1 Tax=Sphingomonas colocasiae TaxID=1848973 RepID=A0ABS7PNM3_9SPHN|nr:MucR family transcriptional regulator [Sphingomonas colocasiae]MBY8822589.1 MucR family transcriptional regulator [Sphingomonas colocasiae]
MADERDEKLLVLTADIVAAHVSNNKVAVSDLAMVIANVHDALAGLASPPAPVEEEPPTPKVSIRASLKPDHLVCLEDGLKMRTLKRHLMTHHNLTPEQYRARWGLPADYPMVAPNYAEQRRNLALAIGLGKRPEKKPTRKKSR